VTFYNGKTLLGSVALVSEQAAYTTSTLKAGKHTIKAVYPGDDTFEPSSGTVKQVVEKSGDADNAGAAAAESAKMVASKTKLTSSGSPSHVGQSVTFTATVTSKHGTIPDGELVTFYEDGKQLVSVPLAGGVATYTITFSIQEGHAIKAGYPGDAEFAPSVGTLEQRVYKYATTTWLSSSLNPSQYGQPVTFSIAVGSEGGPVPTGTVYLFDGTGVLAILGLTNGSASFTTSTLSARPHRLHATYTGDQYSRISRSPYLQQVVEK